jgi:hypothetical protein
MTLETPIMSQTSSNKRGEAAEPLTTRHVFLDTQVYRKLGYNSSNPAMVLLKEQIASHRVVLHTCDITMLEIKRQIYEKVLMRQRELSSIEKDLRRWRQSFPDTAPKNSFELDVENLSEALYLRFSRFLHGECGAFLHEALNVSPASVFEQYFKRSAPFDREGSKEFPDAFVLRSISDWCSRYDEQIYVVTEDKAIIRAVDADPRLYHLSTIQDVLSRAAEDLDSVGEAGAEEALNGQDFDGSLKLRLQDQIKDLTFIYAGELPEGEAYEGDFVDIVLINDWSVVGLNDDRISMILYLLVRVLVEVKYEDREGAMYDREDGRWFGSENTHTQVEDEIDVQMVIDVDRRSGSVREGKIITTDATIYGRSEWD